MQRVLALSFLALSLAACGSDKPTPDDTRAEPDDDDDGESDEGEREEDASKPVGNTRDASKDAEAPRDALVRDAEVLDAGETRDAGAPDAAQADAGRDTGTSSEPLPMTPAYKIPLRVHRADSGLSGAVLAEVLEEVNEIWWKQAGICFEIEVTRSEEVRRDGFDFWFHRSKLGCNTTANGVYCGDHDIHSLDAPNLGKANSSEWNTRRPPARTTAHELGHGLNLDHYNGFADSNDSLMSSGRQGFKLHEDEVITARRRAMTKASDSNATTPCAAVPVVD